MITLKKLPENTDKFQRLLVFFEEVLRICREIDVMPILDGSLAVFLYTNAPISVNDIDLSCLEILFPKILKAALRNGYLAEIKEWHVLQIRKNDTKIEFGDTDFWYPGVDVVSSDYLEVGEETVGVLRLSSLVEFYRIGVENLRKDPTKSDKYNDIKSKFELLQEVFNANSQSSSQ